MGGIALLPKHDPITKREINYMTYNELMSKKPGFWNWEIFSLTHEISIFYYASIIIVILMGIFTIVSAGRSRADTRIIMAVIGVLLVAINIFWLDAYKDYAQHDWMNTYGKEYMITQNITDEVFVDDVSYSYLKQDGQIIAKVQFPMNGDIQTVYAEVEEKDVDETYLEYYINDRNITKQYTKGNAYFGILYIKDGSVGK